MVAVTRTISDVSMIPLLIRDPMLHGGSVNPDTRHRDPDTIGEVRRSIRDDLLPAFTQAREVFQECKSVGFPRSGPLGERTVGALYRSLMDSLVRDTEAALAALQRWQDDDPARADASAVRKSA